MPNAAKAYASIANIGLGQSGPELVTELCTNSSPSERHTSDTIMDLWIKRIRRLFKKSKRRSVLKEPFPRQIKTLEAEEKIPGINVTL